jgi:hypothetical protein
LSLADPGDSRAAGTPLLAELVDCTGADEVMVLTNTHDVTDRAACYERLATVMTDL